MIKIITYDKNPVSLIGKNAAVCYGKRIEDGYSESDYKRGLACIESGHGRALEYASVDVEVSGYSARCIREVYTHIIGTNRLQESTRYANMDNFDYYVPDSIRLNEEALYIYDRLMHDIQYAYKELSELDIHIEDAANVLPLAYNTRIVLKINVRALLHLAEERLCSRAYSEIRKFVNELKVVLTSLGEEWKIISEMMVPKCVSLGYCPEKKSCGMKISKNEAMRVLREYQGIMDLFEPETTEDKNKPEILKKKFNLPEEKQRTCAVCSKPIDISSDTPDGIFICSECYDTKVRKSDWRPVVEVKASDVTDADDGIASKIDRV